MDRTELRDNLARSKDHSPRAFGHLTSNFYLMRAALRYYAVKTGRSVTATRVSDEFPLPVSVTGSALRTLEDLGVIEDRTDSGSSRYMPKNIDLGLMEEYAEVLKDEKEIPAFHDTKS